MHLRWREQHRQDAEAGDSSTFGEEKQFSLADDSGQYFEKPYDVFSLLSIFRVSFIIFVCLLSLLFIKPCNFPPLSQEAKDDFFTEKGSWNTPQNKEVLAQLWASS